ncbi:TRAP transporter substrate-binding protein [Alkalilimnicola sp. S0819]|uniref:TRAP transporter substrate-binding protein n=1 Tax=Alkalilimnicola sp. S0819 TaxID=2613922 RepID=UPI001261EEB8|nr:TRAP transporter substrate-binding protein [Alkalilimnicola sp. S0819]KAB7623334.1 TRAP transporter substrate-binding protein [Alkalilimnicola sp. S0819]MPQ16873.1 C4-dicarboxylate ABC transporter substrate-binding protein [Alkalilimnicola sp. S0819]
MNLRKLLPTLGKLLATAVCAAAVSLPAAAADYTMKIGIIAQNDPLHAYIKLFKERIEAASDGRIEAKLYPGAQLGGESALAEGVQLGTIEMVAIPAVYLKGVDPRFQVADAMGLFEDLDHAYEVLQNPEFRDPFLNVANDNGMRGVSLWVYDTTAFATQEPFQDLDQLRGLKLRVLASDLERQLMEDLGASGVPMPFVEVVPALQRGTIDGVRTSPIIMTAFRVPTVAKYLTITNDAPIAIGGFVSQRFYDRLPEDLQQVVDTVGREVELEMRGKVLGIREMMIGRWQEMGGEVATLPQDQQEKLMRLNREASEKHIGSSEAMQPLYETLKELAAE